MPHRRVMVVQAPSSGFLLIKNLNLKIGTPGEVFIKAENRSFSGPGFSAKRE